MTVLSACDTASKRLRSGTGLSAVYSTQDPFAIELGSLANEVAQDVMKRHDWRKLFTLYTQAGDGVTTAFDLPDDYDRIPMDLGIFLNSTTRPMSSIGDFDTWLTNRLNNWNPSYGEWIIFGGQINFAPALGASDSAKFYYISNLVVRPATGPDKAEFDADDDSFRLNERLLTLGLIWRWRQMKGYDYAEDMQNFEIALSQEILRDKGPRQIVSGPARVPANVTIAYPNALG